MLRRRYTEGQEIEVYLGSDHGWQCAIVGPIGKVQELDLSLEAESANLGDEALLPALTMTQDELLGPQMSSLRSLVSARSVEPQSDTEKSSEGGLSGAGAAERLRPTPCYMVPVTGLSGAADGMVPSSLVLPRKRRWAA